MASGHLAVSDRSGRTEAVSAFRESFDAFYRREFPHMVTLAVVISGSRVAAEDLAQEALLRAHRDWERVSTFEKPGAWLRRVTINLATSTLRRTAAETRARLRLGRPEPIPEPVAEDAALWKAVAALPPKQRAAVALFYLEDLSTAEIATVLGCSDATARVHLHRGRQALASALGRSHQGEDRP